MNYMCYSFQANITAWIVSFLSCVYMLINPQIYSNWLPIFILTFTQIQIFEAIIWTSMNNNKEINSKATRYLSYFLWLQPLINSFAGYMYTKESVLLYMIFFYTLIILFHHFDTIDDKFISTIGPNGHLVWNRTNKNNKQKGIIGNNKLLQIAYIAGLFIPFLFMKNITGYSVIAFGILTFIISNILYKTEFGSMWCYVSVILSILALLFPQLKLTKCLQFNKIY